MFFLFILAIAYYLPFQVALNPVAGIDLASIRLFILLLFFVWLANGLRKKKITITANFQTACVVIFLFLNAFSLFFARNSIWGMRKMLFLLSIFPIYFVLTSVVNGPEKMRKVSSALVSSGALVAFLGIVQFIAQFIVGIGQLYLFWSKHVVALFLGDTFSQSVLAYPSWLVNVSGRTYFRAIAIFPDPHMFAFFLGLLLPLAIALFLRDRKKFWLICAGLIFLADLLTFSRGGYLGLMSGALAVLFFWQNKFPRKHQIAILGAVVFLVLAVIFPGPVSSRLFSSFNLSEGSNVGRLAMWRAASENILKHPVMGVGLGNFSLAVDPLATYREPIYAHNTYLDVAVETGIPSALAFLGIIYFSLNSFIKKSKKNELYLAAAISLIIFSIHSIVETGLYSPVVLTLVLMIVAFSNIQEKNEKST